MTRVLAELLGAEQPQFSHIVQQLERAAGRPSTDIRLTTEITQRVNAKLRELGLDPKDTTSEELYRALEERFAGDEAKVRDTLGLSQESSVQELLLAVQRFALTAVNTKQTFALKPTVAKRLLKKVPPKKAMKQLGYRSLASLLKHEPACLIYAAAFAVESNAWKKKFQSQYVGLQSRDFEIRTIEITLPGHSRWSKLATRLSMEQKQNILVFPELGAVVMLPLTRDLPGLAITNLLLILHGVNEIISTGSYLRLHQVTPEFGQTVCTVSQTEPLTSAQLIGRQVPWKVLQQYYSRNKDAYNPVIFEPHVNPSDLTWHSPERTLESLHAGLRFWRDTPYTSQLQGGASVSLNLLDVAVNYCNGLKFRERISAFSRRLWYLG